MSSRCLKRGNLLPTYRKNNFAQRETGYLRSLPMGILDAQDAQTFVAI